MGWIKIDRGLLDSAIWNTGEEFTKGQAWVDLLLLANFEDTEQFVGYELIKISRGTYMTTIRDLSQRWKWSRTKVANFLHFLELQEMATIKSDTKKTLITIAKYKDYQSAKDTEKTRKRHESDTGKTREGNLLYKERREEGKNIKKGIDVFPNDPELKEAFDAYAEMRKEIKKPLTDRAVSMAIKKLHELSNGSRDKAIAILNQSTFNSWQGLFALKDEQKAAGANQSQGETLNDVLRRRYAEAQEMEGLNEIRGDY